MAACSPPIGSSDLDDALKDGNYQIAVVMYGANDDQSIKVGKDWVKVGSEAWRQAYGERVEKVDQEAPRRQLGDLLGGTANDAQSDAER